VVTAGASGKVKCWGANSAGQLGDGTTTQRTRPVTVLTAAGKPLNGVVSVDAGGSTACAVVTTGAVRCWGNNNHGQLGRGNLVNSQYAVAVSGLTGVTAKARSVTVGTAHACTVLTSGAVRCWGLNSTGQLGDGTLLQRAAPVAVKVTTAGALTGVASVTAGGAHTCAVIGAGAAARVRCWGADTTGQLGNTATGVQKFAVLTAGILTNGASSLSAGTAHTLVVATNALIPPTAIVGWGANSSGQLGDTTSTNRVAPVLNPVL
jgi:alpha-tubulin suppressor-like RCC1 family protein